MKTTTILRFIIISMVILLTTSSITFSQNQFGLLAGVGLSKEGNSLFSTSFKPAFEVDGSYNIDFKNYLDFRIILGYKLRGYRDDITYISSSVTDIDKAFYHLISFGPEYPPDQPHLCQ